MASAIWGLDIGQASIKAVRMERAGSVAHVTRFDVIEIEPGEDESTRPARTHAAMIELLGRQKIGHDPVIVAVPGNQTFFRPFELPPAPVSRLAGIVGFEARNQIPFPINEVLWDFKQLAPSDDGQMRVGLIAVRRELVDQIIALVRQFSLRLEAIQVAPLALYNLVRYEFGTSQPWLVLDGGARVTDFVVADGEEFWFRPLPQSGNDLTRSLEQKFRMTFQEAEELKLKMGESKQAGKIFQVIEPMLRNLAGDIQRTIGYYKGIRKDADIQNILAVGSAFRLPGILDFLDQALDTKINHLSQLSRIRLAPGVDAGWWQEELPSMAVALGLGLQGLGLAAVSLDLLPEAIRQERMLRKKRPVVALGVGLALTASVLGYLTSVRELGALDANLEQINKGLEDVNRFADKHKRMQNPKELEHARLEEKAKTTARDRGWILECLDALAAVKATDGKAVLGPEAGDGDGGVYIKNVTMSRSDPFAGAARIRDQSVENWFKQLTPGGASVKPLVAILHAQVAGPSYVKGKGGEAARSTHAKALADALRFSSKVFLKDGAPKALGVDGRILRGFIGRSAEDRKKGQIRFWASEKATPIEISLDEHVERLGWFRDVKQGIAGPQPEARDIDTHEYRENMRAREGMTGEPGEYHAREYLDVLVGWVYDDGSAELAKEEAAP